MLKYRGQKSLFVSLKFITSAMTVSNVIGIAPQNDTSRLAL